LAGSWVSKDISKPYYGKEVYVAPSGKITEAGSVGVLPSGATFNISETSPAVQAYFSGKTPTPAPATQKYYLETEGKKLQVSKELQEKVMAGQAAAIKKAAKPKPIYTLTGKGVAYTDTGELVKDVWQREDRRQAFQYLAPAERFLATRAGSKGYCL